MLTESRELETEHGKRRCFGILLFQDLRADPPADPDAGAERAAVGVSGRPRSRWPAAKAALVLFLLLRFGPPLMRGWFLRVARLRSHEVFTLNVLLATLLFAWLTGKRASRWSSAPSWPAC